MMMLLQIYCSISKISQPLVVLGERVTLCLVVVPLLLNSVMIMLQVVKKFCERLHWRGVPTPFPNALFLVGGIWTPHNTWFFGPTQVYIQNGISISLAVLAQLVVMSNRHTHTQTRNINNNRPHLCTLCMQCGLIMALEFLYPPVNCIFPLVCR